MFTVSELLSRRGLRETYLRLLQGSKSCHHTHKIALETCEDKTFVLSGAVAKKKKKTLFLFLGFFWWRYRRARDRRGWQAKLELQQYWFWAWPNSHSRAAQGSACWSWRSSFMMVFYSLAFFEPLSPLFFFFFSILSCSPLSQLTLVSELYSRFKSYHLLSIEQSLCPFSSVLLSFPSSGHFLSFPPSFVALPLCLPLFLL